MSSYNIFQIVAVKKGQAMLWIIKVCLNSHTIHYQQQE